MVHRRLDWLLTFAAVGLPKQESSLRVGVHSRRAQKKLEKITRSWEKSGKGRFDVSVRTMGAAAFCSKDAAARAWIRRVNSALDRDSFDDVSRDSLVPAIVESRRSRVGMTSEVLDIFKWNVLTQQIRDSRNAERMRRQT
jgi:hypothetical protein